MLLKKLSFADVRNKREIKRLYRSAFPKEERAPWRVLKKGTEIFAYYDQEAFVGFTVSVPAERFYYVFFLAVAEDMRSKNYGSAILQEIISCHKEPVVLDMEELDETAPNYPQRVRRMEFYEKNGFRRTGFTYEIYGVRYETLYAGEGFDLEEYSAFLASRFRTYRV